jgi:hypothetical protein
MWKQLEIIVSGGVKRTDNCGQKWLLWHVYILLAHIYTYVYTHTHFCPVTRRITVLPSRSSLCVILSTCWRRWPENELYGICIKRNFKMLREKGRWMRRGNKGLCQFQIEYRSHFLPKNFDLLPRLPLLDLTFGFCLTRHGVLLISLLVYDLVSLIFALFSPRPRLCLGWKCWPSYWPLLRDPFPLPCASLSITLDLFQSLNLKWTWVRWKLGIKKRESKWQYVSS